jgi:diadenosine tetraphosphatase ApaH/serine/threonine PP2A family protein phosphatase
MDYSYYYEAARHALDEHARVLSAANLKWLKSLPYSVRLNEVNVELCHGSPVRLEEFDYIFEPEQARLCLPMYDDMAQLTLIGHSHLCKVFMLTSHSVEELPAQDLTLQADRKYIASVGSVGQPRDQVNLASFVVFDTEARRLMFRRIEYDVEAAHRKVLDAKLERQFAYRLFIGT